MVTEKQLDTLLAEARRAADMAYVPYSKFRVGAALLCKDGSIVVGCNVENRSYGLTICAERNAIAAAITMGKIKFEAVAISTPDSAEPVGPCGACRQVLSEFIPPGAPIRFAGNSHEQVNTTLGALIPMDSLHELGANG
jgi:cytidine deaminase